MTNESRPSHASVMHRPNRIARERGEPVQAVQMRYALERLLYRLANSSHYRRFILKGAMLFALWADQPHRPTMDLDLLARGNTELASIAEAFCDLCRVEANDGFAFDEDTIQVEQVREQQEYQGLRLRLLAQFGRARMKVTVDIGVGDAVTPDPVLATYPTLLGDAAPLLLAYPRETLVAEKYQAMVMLGFFNSRMKDFYDFWVLARDFAFEGPVLLEAIRATFQRRKTPIPQGIPTALTDEFSRDHAKQEQWRRFAEKVALADAVSLDSVLHALRTFLIPPTAACAASSPFGLAWNPPGPWQSRRATAPAPAI